MLWVEKDFFPELIKSFDDFYASTLGGYAPAQYELGRLYMHDNVPVDKNIKPSLRKTHNIGKIFAFLKLSAEQGYVDTQSEFAIFYNNALFDLMDIYKNEVYSIPKNESEYDKWRKKLSPSAN